MKKIKFIIWQVSAVILYIHMLLNLEPKSISTEHNFAALNFLIQVAIMVALSLLLAPKPKQPKKPLPIGLEQFDIPTAEEGRPIPVLFGKRYIQAPNVVWYGHLRSSSIIG
jgi:hypothetical protein